MAKKVTNKKPMFGNNRPSLTVDRNSKDAQSFIV